MNITGNNAISKGRIILFQINPILPECNGNKNKVIKIIPIVKINKKHRSHFLMNGVSCSV